MCNLYGLASTIDELREFYGSFEGDRSNLPEYDAIYPNREAPILIGGGTGLALKTVTWGVPAWKKGMRPITNVRNLTSPFWKNMLAKPEQRCLVPLTRFCEWEGEKGSKRKVWFGLKDQPIFSFAGIWRDTDDGPRMAFLTCEPNETVGAVHPKAMPVILAAERHETWLAAGYDEAVELAKPYPDDKIMIVDREGDKP